MLSSSKYDKVVPAISGQRSAVSHELARHFFCHRGHFRYAQYKLRVAI